MGAATRAWDRHGHFEFFTGRPSDNHGSLYPALHRLERQGWIEAEWKLTENKQRAKYYRLTRTGKKQLLAAESKWNRLIEAIARVMEPAKS